MAELLTLARPYAKAAFAFASEQGATDNWSNVLQVLSAAVQDEAFSAYLSRPELTPVEQVSLFAKVLGEDQTTAVSNFLTLLAENDRLTLLPEIETEYELLKSQNNNVVDLYPPSPAFRSRPRCLQAPRQQFRLKSPLQGFLS